jgi:GT2 family glycosyltransferase
VDIGEKKPPSTARRVADGAARLDSTPALAVIIPVYDAYPALSNTLTSLALQIQDGPRLETIVIDNNSTLPPPHSLYQRFRAELRMTFVQQPALAHPFALSRARNLGMRLTQAKWILLLDADCVPGPGFLGAVRQAMEAPSSAFIATGERIFIDALEEDALATSSELEALMCRPRVPSGSNYWLHRDRRMPAMCDLARSRHPWAYMHAGVLLYPAAQARRVGGFDERYDGHWGYEDADFAYRMISRAGCEPRYLEQMLVLHQEAPGEYGRQDHKWDKRTNPNWRRVCATIPGFEQFKRRQWQALGVEVLL